MTTSAIVVLILAFSLQGPARSQGAEPGQRPTRPRHDPYNPWALETKSDGPRLLEKPESSRGTLASPTPASTISGRIKSVDVEKKTLTATVGEKEQVFSVANAKLLRPDGDEIAGGLPAVKTVLERQAVSVTVKMETKDGREVITEVRFQIASEAPPQP